MGLATPWEQFATLPQRAIDAFEQIHRVNVAVHDLTGLLGTHLAQSHGYHRHPICQAVKQTEVGHRCWAWELDQLREALRIERQGRVQICHMGLLEWVVPVFAEEELAIVLFAGPRTPGVTPLTVHGEVVAIDTPTPHAPRKMPEAITDARQVDAMLESLRQLGARLHAWLVEARVRLRRDSGGTRSDEPRRDSVIRQYVRAEHTQPLNVRSLAARLGLSPSRTAHVVRHLTGQTLAQLVHEARVQTASWLLAQTDLPLKQIIRQVGYEDISYFHRTFRKKTGLTPALYRRKFRV